MKNAVFALDALVVESPETSELEKVVGKVLELALLDPEEFLKIAVVPAGGE